MGIKSIEFPKFVTPAVPKAYMDKLNEKMDEFNEKLKTYGVRNAKEVLYKEGKGGMTSKKQKEELDKAFKEIYQFAYCGKEYFKNCKGVEKIQGAIDAIKKPRTDKSKTVREKMTSFLAKMKLSKGWDDYNPSPNEIRVTATACLKYINDIVGLTGLRYNSYYDQCEKLHESLKFIFSWYIEEYNKVHEHLVEPLKSAKTKLNSYLSEFDTAKSKINLAISKVDNFEENYKDKLDGIIKDDKKMFGALKPTINEFYAEFGGIRSKFENLKKIRHNEKFAIYDSLIVKGEGVMRSANDYRNDHITIVTTLLNNLSSSSDKTAAIAEDIKRLYSNMKKYMISLDNLEKAKVKDLGNKIPNNVVKSIDSAVKSLKGKHSSVQSLLDKEMAKLSEELPKLDQAIIDYKKEKSAAKAEAIKKLLLTILFIFTSGIGNIAVGLVNVAGTEIKDA